MFAGGPQRCSRAPSMATTVSSRGARAAGATPLSAAPPASRHGATPTPTLPTAAALARDVAPASPDAAAPLLAARCATTAVTSECYLQRQQQHHHGVQQQAHTQFLPLPPLQYAFEQQHTQQQQQQQHTQQQQQSRHAANGTSAWTAGQPSAAAALLPADLQQQAGAASDQHWQQHAGGEPLRQQQTRPAGPSSKHRRRRPRASSQQQKQEQQPDPSASGEVREFRVANATQPGELAAALLLWLQARQGAQERRSSSSSSEAACVEQAYEAVLSCMSASSLHAAFQGASIAAAQAAQLRAPAQLLLQPQLMHITAQADVLGCAAAGQQARRLQPRYLLWLSWLPLGCDSVDSSSSEAVPQETAVGVLRHAMPLTCDTARRSRRCGAEDAPGDDISTRQARQRTHARDGTSTSSSSNSNSSDSPPAQRASAPPACRESAYQLSWRLVGLLKGAWPAGLAFATPRGALLAFKALLRARRQLATSGADVYASVQAVHATAAAAAAGNSRSVELWAVATPAAAGGAAATGTAEAVQASPVEELLQQRHATRKSRWQQHQLQWEQQQRERAGTQLQPAVAWCEQELSTASSMSASPRHAEQQQQQHAAAARQADAVLDVLPAVAELSLEQRDANGAASAATRSVSSSLFASHAAPV